MTKRHIFLTGEKQVGKSTVLRKVLKDRAYTGFRTLPFELDGVKRGYTLHSLTDLPDGMNDAPCVVRVNQNRHAAVEPVFEGAGAAALTQALACDTPLILMDELGKVERRCECFLQAVRACLDSAHHVIGVVQRGDAPMQQEIRNRADVLCIEVTPDNREEIPAQVEEILRAWGV